MTDKNLPAILTAAQNKNRDSITVAQEALSVARATANRLDLAEALLTADLPAGTTISIVDWKEDPNGDGTYDVIMNDAYAADGQRMDDLDYDELSGNGATPAGRYNEDGDAIGTDWDLFMDNDRIVVEKVFAWLRDLRL